VLQLVQERMGGVDARSWKQIVQSVAEAKSDEEPPSEASESGEAQGSSSDIAHGRGG
jgi:hypothetical protein